MNFPLAREDAEKNAGARSCSYCNKVFNNYRALGGHLRIHQDGKPSGTLNYLGSSSNSTDTTRIPLVSLPNSQQNCSPGVNNRTSFSRATPPFDPSRVICSNETNHASLTGFTCGNAGVAQTPIVMFPINSYTSGSGATSHCSGLASGTTVPGGTHAAMTYAAFASSGSVESTGFDIDTSLHLGPNGVCQCNTDEFHISRDGFPPTHGDSLQNVQGPPPISPPISSPDKADHNDHGSLVTCQNGKRPYLTDESETPDVMNDSKKPKIDSALKELPLFMDVDDPVPAPESCFGAEESPGDVDLSLHL